MIIHDQPIPCIHKYPYTHPSITIGGHTWYNYQTTYSDTNEVG